MIPDAECVKIVAEILTNLELGDFVIKVYLYVFVTSCRLNDNWVRAGHMYFSVCAAQTSLDKI